MEQLCGIYMIKNVVNGKVYVGQSKQLKKRLHHQEYMIKSKRHTNKRIKNDLLSLGSDSFVISILEICSKEELDNKEQYYIEFYNSTNPNCGYNIQKGGRNTYKYTEELRDIHSKAIIKYYNDHPEKREEASKRSKKMYQDPEFYRKYRELRSSPEYRKKISESHKGKRPSEKAIRSFIERTSKPVRCVETGQVFPSARAAAQSLPGNKNVQAVCENKRRTAGGFHWVWAEKEEKAV